MTIEPARQQRGLTLLEMMVVLMIASMAIALGFQSLGQWRRANVAISSISGAVQQSTLIESWLKSSLRSLIPVEDQPFKASATELEGIAIQPVLSHQGGATLVKWEVQPAQKHWELVLHENQKRTSLPLIDVKTASFAYIDKEGRAHSQWPPKLGQHDHLPTAILLRQEMADGYLSLWTVAIAGARNPTFNPFEADLD